MIMANEIKTQLKTDLQNAKNQGGTRAARIREILRAAVVQTFDEVKQGTGEIRAIATDSFSTVVDTLEDDKTTASSEANATEKNATKPLMAKLFVAIKTRLFTQFRHQAIKLDDELGARYGDRYQAGKQRLDRVANQMTERYHQAVATAKEQGSTPLQQTQVDMQDRAGALGAAAARTEQQIKLRLKSLLQTTASKL
jgi:hypothetical protein